MRTALLALGLLAGAAAPVDGPFVHPELRPAYEQLRRDSGDDGGLTDEGVLASRPHHDALRASAAERGLRVEQATGPDGEVRVLVFEPADDPEEDGAARPGLLHLHGGGYVFGSADGDAGWLASLAEELGCVIVSVDYRLAPEHPFPAALDDAYAGLAWMHANAVSLGVDPDRIAIKGESAGGGLAAQLAVRARDAGEVPVLFQVLVYPMLDDRTASTRAVPDGVGEVGWSAAANRYAWGAYLGREPGGDDAPAGAVPARESVEGLPPAWIGVGGVDLFVEEDVAHALRLVGAGVPTELHLVPGAHHGFDWLDVPVAAEFRASWRAALTRAWADAE